MAIVAENGIDKKEIAKLLHDNSRTPEKKFIHLNLLSFDKDYLEGHFFITFKELLSFPSEEGLLNPKNMVGTIFLQGIELIEETFRQTLIQYIKDKRSLVRVIISTTDSKFSRGFETLTIPPLRERKEDISAMVVGYLNKYAPNVKYISPKAIEILSYYDYPGNYDELEGIISSSAVIFPMAEVFNLKSLQLNLPAFDNIVENKVFSQGSMELLKVRREYEKSLIELTLEKSNGDKHEAARFLDFPYSIFLERLKALGIS